MMLPTSAACDDACYWSSPSTEHSTHAQRKIVAGHVHFDRICSLTIDEGNQEMGVSAAATADVCALL
jgi:hypothetical protein